MAGYVKYPEGNQNQVSFLYANLGSNTYTYYYKLSL